MIQAGVLLKVVQEAAGHQSITSTMHYAHFAPSQVADAMAVPNWKQDDDGGLNINALAITWKSVGSAATLTPRQGIKLSVSGQLTVRWHGWSMPAQFAFRGR